VQGSGLIWRGSVILVGSLLLLLVGCTGDDNGPPSDGAASDSVAAGQPTGTGESDVDAVSADADLRTAVQEVAERVRPAVVHITNQQGQSGLSGGGQQIPAGVGSGVIYDDDGLILTNDHVIAGAESLLVTLPDGRSFPGALIGRDPATDLAVVQIEGDDLPVAEIGDASELAVGEWVVAIGNALALEGGPTVTTGVVSALDRAVLAPSNESQAGGPFLFGLIQTDAAINPGNSGGPLINLGGQVVGINTLAAGGAEGIGFAIASPTFTRIARQLVEDGQATHAYVGVRYVPLNPAIAAELGTDIQDGVAIGAVEPGSPADQAGLQPRDIITEVNGEPLEHESSFADAIDQHQPGDTVTFTVVRAGEEREIEVTLGESPAP
jgi:S1-C subfamily serine protease